MEQIQTAATRSVSSIFLFTKDDDLDPAGSETADRSVPRDNVVFEAGYFSAHKGKHNVLIVREEGSRLPADLSGDIYAFLRDKDDISPIETAIESFLGAM